MRAASARGCRRRRRSAGLTLLEILLVLAIVGILAAAVAVGVGDVGARRQVQAEAERLALAIEQARATAARSNEVWGVALAHNGYSFTRLVRGTNAWLTVDRAPFGLWMADGGVGFQVDIAFGAQQASRGAPDHRADGNRSGRPRASADESDGDADDEEDVEWPAIAIFPSGEITPLSILVSATDVPAWVVRSDGIARVRALSEEEADALAPRLRARMR